MIRGLPAQSLFGVLVTLLLTFLHDIKRYCANTHEMNGRIYPSQPIRISRTSHVTSDNDIVYHSQITLCVMTLLTRYTLSALR